MFGDSSSPAPRLRIGIIGAGRVGAVLGAAWERSGHRVVAHSVGDAGAERAAALLPRSIRRSPEEVPREADLVLVATPGQDAGRVANHLALAGLPTRLQQVPGGCGDADALLDAMAQDKKVRDGALTFILARGIGRSFIAPGVDRAAVRAAMVT